MNHPFRELRKEIARARSDSARVQFGEVTDVSPVEVTFDGGESSIPAYVAPGVQTVIGERVAVLKHGNAPGIVLGISTDEPSGVTGDWIAAGTITAYNIAAGSITAVAIEAHSITAELIAANTITAAEIAAGTITATEIKSNTILAGNIKSGTITTSELAANTIEAGDIKAGTITSTEIAANTIKAANIAAGTITTAELLANTIEAGDIKAHTITSGEIAAGTITSVEIAAATITGSNIAGSTITASNITVTKLSSLSADLGTITAGIVTGATLQTAESGKRVVIDTNGLKAYNASEAVLDFDTSTGNLKIKGAIETGSTIPASAVTGQLTNEQLEAIAAAKITGQISESQIAADSITSAKIVAGTILSGDIAAGEIKATNIAADAVESAKIKSEAVESSHIKANTIVAGDIAASTITATQIASGTITATQIASGTITATQLSATAIDAMTITGAVVRSGSSNPKVAFDSTGFYVTNASGTKEAIVNTEGLSLLATSGAIEPLNTVKWTSGSNWTAQMTSYLASKVAGLILTANPSGVSTDTGLAILAAHGKSAAQSALRVETTSSESGTVKAETPFGNRTLYDDKGKSHFLQLNELAQRKINHGGEVTAEWTAEGPNSQIVTVNHGLGITPTNIQLTAGSSEGSTVPVTPRYIEGSKSSTQFKFKLQAPVNVVKGTKVKVDWLAIGQCPN